jgi:hypothetical protein
MYSGSGIFADHMSLSQYSAMCLNGREHSFLGLDMSLVKICPYVEYMYLAFQTLFFFSALLLAAGFLNILLSKDA